MSVVRFPGEIGHTLLGSGHSRREGVCQAELGFLDCEIEHSGLKQMEGSQGMKV